MLLFLGFLKLCQSQILNQEVKTIVLCHSVECKQSWTHPLISCMQYDKEDLAKTKNDVLSFF